MVLIFQDTNCLKMWISLIEISILLKIDVLFQLVNLLDLFKCLGVLFHLGFELLAVKPVEHWPNEVGACENLFLWSVRVALAFRALVMMVVVMVVRVPFLSWLLAWQLFELNIVASVIMMMSMTFILR